MSAHNADLYLLLKYDASEKDIATMFSIASLIAALATLTLMNFAKKDAKKMHMATVALQAFLFAGITVAPAVWLAIVLFSLRDTIGVLSDSTLESILISSDRTKGLMISAIQISWELFTGLGKFLGSILVSMNPDLPLLLASIILVAYMAIFKLLSGEEKRERATNSVQTPKHRDFQKRLPILDLATSYKFDTI